MTDASGQRCGDCNLFMLIRPDGQNGLSGAGRCTWTVPDGLPMWVKQGPRDVLTKDGKGCEAWQAK